MSASVALELAVLLVGFAALFLTLADHR